MAACAHGARLVVSVTSWTFRLCRPDVIALSLTRAVQPVFVSPSRLFDNAELPASFGIKADWPDRGAVRSHTCQLSLLENGAAEVGTAKIGTAEISTMQIRLLQGGPAELSLG